MEQKEQFEIEVHGKTLTVAITDITGNDTLQDGQNLDDIEDRAREASVSYEIRSGEHLIQDGYDLFFVKDNHGCGDTNLNMDALNEVYGEEAFEIKEIFSSLAYDAVAEKLKYTSYYKEVSSETEEGLERQLADQFETGNDITISGIEYNLDLYSISVTTECSLKPFYLNDFKWSDEDDLDKLRDDAFIDTHLIGTLTDPESGKEVAQLEFQYNGESLEFYEHNFESETLYSDDVFEAIYDQHGLFEKIDLIHTVRGRETFEEWKSEILEQSRLNTI